MKLARFAVNGQILSGRFEQGQLVVPYDGTYHPDEVVQ